MPSPRNKPPHGYRPEIDGLRAVAVIAVVLFHLDIGCPGGFIGVDVFFVISGFLITGIIRRDLTNQSFSFVEFWARRTRRIFPALFVMLVATLAAGYWLLLPHELEDLGEAGVAQALFLANVHFWRSTGYFAGPAEAMPLLHTWSLAVEEQFYLCFPLALYAMRKLADKRLFGAISLAALVSFAGSVYGTTHHTGATFFLIPTRAWELLAGCSLAVWPWNQSSVPWRDALLAGAGMIAVLLPIFLYDSSTPFPGLAALPPVFGTAAIIQATGNTPRLWVGRVLSLRPVVFAGLISYSLYLWHWPAIVFTKMYWEDFGGPQVAFAVTASLCLAVLSFKLVETPFRHKAVLKQNEKLFACAAALSLSAITVCWLFITTNGLASRFPRFSPDLAEDVEWAGFEFRSFPPVNRPLVHSDFQVLGKHNDGRPDFFVWGDSHAMALSDSLNNVALETDLYGRSFMLSSFLPLPHVHLTSESPKRLKWRQRLMDYLDETRPHNLVLISAWSTYAGKNMRDRRGQHHLSGTSVMAHNAAELGDFCAARGIQLWIVKEVPYTNEPSAARDNLAFSVGRRSRLSNRQRSIDEHIAEQAKIAQVFRPLQNGKTRFVDPAPLLFDQSGFTVNYRGGRALYRDKGHLTRWGAATIKPVISAMFAEMSLQLKREIDTNN